MAAASPEASLTLSSPIRSPIQGPALLRRRGPDAARGELECAYAEHAGVLTRLARSLLGSQDDAEDLIHDVFIEAWERWDAYDASRGSLRSWLAVRVRSRAIDRLRARGRRRESLLEPVEEASDADPFRLVQADRAWRALASAPERLRQVVELRFGCDLSVAEAATRIGVPAGTVKSRQSHALRFLRAQVDLEPTA